MKNERRPRLQFGAAMDNSAAGLKSTSTISGIADNHPWETELRVNMVDGIS